MAKVALTVSKLRRTVWDKTAGRCWYCGKQTNPWRDFCIDHVIPQSKGGTDDVSNLVPCCRTCNTQKRNRSIEDFRTWVEGVAGLKFTSEQLEYLRAHNVPPPTNPSHKFYFELMEGKPHVD